MQNEWEKSYSNRDNFVFYPHEEVIRFVSRHIRKRIGLDEFQDMDGGGQRRVFDLGCGIGRHVVYCHEMGLAAYGIDISETAINTARLWAERIGLEDPASRLQQGDMRDLPWKDDFFDYALSHGVLDSVPFSLAREGCMELARVMKKGGLFYCDLISGDDSGHAREYSGEEIVATTQEQGTVQSYFNMTTIQLLLNGLFDIADCVLIRRENVLKGGYTSRYHLALRRV